MELFQKAAHKVESQYTKDPHSYRTIIPLLFKVRHNLWYRSKFFSSHRKRLPSQSLPICILPKLIISYIRDYDVFRLYISMRNSFFMKAIHCLTNHLHLSRSFFLSYLRLRFLFQEIIKSSSFKIFKKYVEVLLIIKYSK